MEHDFSYRQFTDSDFPLAVEWTKAHGKRSRPIIRDWLPDNGFIVYLHGVPVIMYWLYFDLSCTVCFVDWLITRPGQSFLEVTKPAIIWAHHNSTRAAMIENGANTLVMRTQKAIAHHAFEGWFVNEETAVTMSYVYSPEELTREAFYEIMRSCQ